MSVANIVTISRVILCLVTVSILWVPDETLRWLAFVFTAAILAGDGIDGYLARKLKQESKLGAMLDIAGDRIVEMAYWIVFAALSWIPIWIPLLFLVRGILVDTVRACASAQGLTAFGEKTMMQTHLGKFLVASNFSRFTYAVSKALAFCLLIGAHTAWLETTMVPPAALILAYISSAFCLLRGLPVLIEGKSLISDRRTT